LAEQDLVAHLCDWDTHVVQVLHLWGSKSTPICPGIVLHFPLAVWEPNPCKTMRIERPYE
jgi:hypothetical protein